MIIQKFIYREKIRRNHINIKDSALDFNLTNSVNLKIHSKPPSQEKLPHSIMIKNYWNIFTLLWEKLFKSIQNGPLAIFFFDCRFFMKGDCNPQNHEISLYLRWYESPTAHILPLFERFFDFTPYPLEILMVRFHPTYSINYSNKNTFINAFNEVWKKISNNGFKNSGSVTISFFHPIPWEIITKICPNLNPGPFSSPNILKILKYIWVSFFSQGFFNLKLIFEKSTLISFPWNLKILQKKSMIQGEKIFQNLFLTPSYSPEYTFSVHFLNKEKYFTPSIRIPFNFLEKGKELIQLLFGLSEFQIPVINQYRKGIGILKLKFDL